MPIIKSALKKLRQSEKHAIQNRKKKSAYKDLLDVFRKTPSEKNLTKVFSSLDKLAKTRIIHKNKAARLKSRLSKRLGEKKKS